MSNNVYNREQLEEAFKAGRQGYVSYQEYCNQKDFKKFLDTKQSDSKDWEIVAYRGKYLGYNNVLFQKVKGGLFSAMVEISGQSETEEQVRRHCEIHSVKRLTDGEVFSVGDLVETDTKNTFVIKSFEINNGWSGNMRVVHGNNHGASIKILRKVDKPKPLFVTEDGKEVYKGDVYWYVVTSDYDFLSDINWEARSDVANWEGDWVSRRPMGGKQFGTKEEAEEFILLNRPFFSVKDINLIVSGVVYLKFETSQKLFERFEQLAKEKLSGKK